MKTKHLPTLPSAQSRWLATFALLLLPLWAVAQQYWESGTTKVNMFFNYSSGDNTYNKTQVSYLINPEQDGRVEFYAEPLGDVRITGIALHAVQGDELLPVASSGGTTLAVDDVAAGVYQVTFTGQPTDRAGQGGNFLVGYVHTPAPYVNDPEPNDTWERAYQIESGNLQQGHLGYKRGSYTDTEDWFKIVVPDEGTVTFTTHSSFRLRLSWLGMYTLNAEGNAVDYRNDKNMDAQGKDSTVVYTVPDVAPGTYYVRLRRYNGCGGYKLTYDFKANTYGADSPDNDTWQNAVDMALDTPTDGRLGYHFNGNTDTEDWMKIVVPEEGKITFTAKAETSLRLSWLGMYTLNADGTAVDYRNDKYMDAQGRDSTVVYEVPDVAIGTYYVRLRRYNGYGGYTLTAYFTSHADEADPEPNDTWQEAMPLKSGPAVTGQLGYTFNGNTDAVDWYKIVVPKEGSVTFSTRTETTLRLSWLGMYTLNADGNAVDYRNDKYMDAQGKDSTVVYTVPDVAPGTYYVQLKRYNGYGTYSLQYVHNPNAHENDPEPNNEWAASTLIESGTIQQGCLGYHFNGNTDTEDWFRIELPDEGKVTFAATAETTLRLSWLGMYTLNAEGTAVDYRNDKYMDAQGKDSTVVYEVPDCKPGTYYVRLRRYNGYGGYRLDYTFTPNTHAQDNLDNDTWQQGNIIENHTTQEGRLGYHFNGDTDNEDWFIIQLPDEGKVTFAATAETTLRLSWLGMYTLNAEGTAVDYRNDKYMDAQGKDSTVVYEVPDCKPGTYYVRLRRYNGYGGYRLNYSFTPNTHGQDNLDNDTWQQGDIIETGITQQGRLGYRFNGDTDTEDWFRIELPYVGNITLSVHAEPTLRLSWLGLYIPNAEGSAVDYRTDKNVNAQGNDTTVTFSVSGLGAGTYYVRLRRYNGYGGYTLKYEYERNPWDRDNLQNGTFAQRFALTEGETVATTLGYRYREQNNEDWYDLGMMHGRQIDVTVSPDTTHTLNIGVPTLYIYQGDNDNGTPILQQVASTRIERSQGTISYIDQNTTDRHYVFHVPNANTASYGGYTIRFGDAEGIDNTLMQGNVRIMAEGRNTVRKGVPCENPITVSNLSNEKSGKFLLSITASENVNIIGFRLPTRSGRLYLPVQEVTTLDGADCEHTILFYVPALNPWESYTFTMISEGKGDIAYAPRSINTQHPTPYTRNKIVVNSNTFAVVNALGNVAGADRHVNVDDYLVHRIGDVYDLTGEQRLKLSQLMQLLVERKAETGQAAFSVMGMLQEASEMCGIDLLDATCPLVTIIRQFVLDWIYQTDDSSLDETLDILDGKAAITDVVASWDPNEMVGPQGVGDEHYIGQTQTVSYRILFENKAEAGDAAYRIRISDELDESVFDVSTVRFGETSHDGVGYNWKMTREGNRLSWDIEGIELPPNVNAPEGEGFVTFSVDLKPGLADGTQIRNMATIIFDKNFPIETNEFCNTLDLTPPTATKAVATWNAAQGAYFFDIEADDPASGIADYQLFVADNGADFSYAAQHAAHTFTYQPATLPADADLSFIVYVVDNVGNIHAVTPEVSSVATGIDTFPSPGESMEGTPSPVYDLQGRLVYRGYAGTEVRGYENSDEGNLAPSRPRTPAPSMKKGIYIIGGRKFVVR